jgi:AcrR family transcriptional regulator
MIQTNRKSRQQQRRRIGRRRPAGKTPQTAEPASGATEARILDAAHAVFLRRGTAGARMQEIAEEAGVNQALLHYYFRSKDRLSMAAFERAARDFMPTVLNVLVSDADLDDKVRRIVELELDHLSRAPYLPGYIISEITHHPDRARQLIAAVLGRAPEEVRPQLVATLGAQIAERVKQRAMRPITPDQFIVNLMSLCIFPFAARPMLSAMLGMDDAAFGRFIARRREELPAFFLGALRP